MVKIKVGEIQSINEKEGAHDFSDRLQEYYGNYVESMDPWKGTTYKQDEAET